MFYAFHQYYKQKSVECTNSAYIAINASSAQAVQAVQILQAVQVLQAVHKQCKYCKYCKQCTSRPLQQNEPRTGEPPELKVHITYIALHLASLQSAAGFCADLESAASPAATTELALHLCSNPSLSDCLTCLKDSLADTICTCTYTPSPVSHNVGLVSKSEQH